MNKYSKLQISGVLFVVLLFGVTARSQEEPGAEGRKLRSNGTNWFVLHPAVINVAKGAFVGLDLSDFQNPMGVAITEEASLRRLKKWLIKELYLNMNLHPSKPASRSVAYHIVIILYASDTLDDRKERLVFIPLTPLVFNLGPEEFAKKMEELEALVAGCVKEEASATPDGNDPSTTRNIPYYPAFKIMLEDFWDTEQDGARQPATAVDPKSEGSEEPKPESGAPSQ